uniref:Uncharacterized protein n=1 Tax=Spongospora subterranea TaxID=70186 RepID=A0A0H5QT89_9EUKA|eukprot:CRZ04937.1 hypothetical protein [Spongospora subterranea]
MRCVGGAIDQISSVASALKITLSAVRTILIPLRDRFVRSSNVEPADDRDWLSAMIDVPIPLKLELLIGDSSDDSIAGTQSERCGKPVSGFILFLTSSKAIRMDDTT